MFSYKYYRIYADDLDFSKQEEIDYDKFEFYSSGYCYSIYLVHDNVIVFKIWSESAYAFNCPKFIFIEVVENGK